METWLDHDKTIIIDKALRHYRLAWREVIAHTFLQTPANNSRRAHERRGPWRYSKYDIRLFLITQDGVREFGTELDFEHALFHGQERNNFRFDAVSSVRVTKADDGSHTLELTLMNGPANEVNITGPDASIPDQSDPFTVSPEIELDAAGFAHTLHILEGIAAEGKKWIDRDPHATGNLDGSFLATGDPGPTPAGASR